MAKKTFDEMTPLELAQAFEAGEEPGDYTVSSWRLSRPNLWEVAVDPEWRARLLKQAAKTLEPPPAPQVHYRAAPPLIRHSQLEEAINKLQRTMESPVVPLYDDKGKLVGAHRAIPEAPTQPLPAQPVTMLSPRQAKALDARIDQLIDTASQNFQILQERIDTLIDTASQNFQILQERIEVLEAGGGAPGLRAGRIAYAGIWRRDQQYDENEFVTSSGALWMALVPSTGVRPGAPSTTTFWKMVAKSGELEAE